MGPKSTFSILPNTTVHWENNHAALGGAIYVENVIPANYCTSLGSYMCHASFNSLARICPMVLMSNLFSRTTLLMLQKCVI